MTPRQLQTWSRIVDLALVVAIGAGLALLLCGAAGWW